ncbi:MAG: transposase [Candidatus Binatia bacterium]
MPNYRRARVDGGTYFFTVNTFRRQRFLIDPDVRAALRAGIAIVRAEHPFVIEAWVLLPDHMHALWTLPEADHDFPTRWRIIKSTVTQRCGPRLHRPELITARRIQRHQSTLWQPRFWEHTIRDEIDFERHVNYIHGNPVKHSYVRQVADWPYSSFHRYVNQGLLPRDWGGTGTEEDDADFGE